MGHRASTTLARDQDGYEGALRSLDAEDDLRFAVATQKWPEDLRVYLSVLASASYTPRA